MFLWWTIYPSISLDLGKVLLYLSCFYFLTTQFEILKAILLSLLLFEQVGSHYAVHEALLGTVNLIYPTFTLITLSKLSPR